MHLIWVLLQHPLDGECSRDVAQKAHALRTVRDAELSSRIPSGYRRGISRRVAQTTPFRLLVSTLGYGCRSHLLCIFTPFFLGTDPFSFPILLITMGLDCLALEVSIGF